MSNRQHTIRHATPEDATAIQRLVNGYAERELMLPRSLSDIYENIRDYFVAEVEDTLVGCAALHVSWKDLAELKSLAVAESHQGLGLGKLLITACLNDAARLGIGKVFALTYVPELFERLSFRRVDKALLPRKVWTECVHCPKFHGCTEIAVLLELT